MLVVNSFDLWQKDTFFSAAEDVQQSADTMASTYRAWVRERREGTASKVFDVLCRELQTALGTAKWQLEEFEKAVRLSYRSCANDATTTRHRQFVAAIENQISHIEAELRDSFIEEHKNPLRWVTLEEDEHDEFAEFLSGVPGTSKSMKDEHIKLGSSAKEFIPDRLSAQINLDIDFNFASEIDTHAKTEFPKDDITMEIDVIKLEGKEVTGTKEDIRCQVDRPIVDRKAWKSLDISPLKIVIDNGDEQNTSLFSRNEVTPKAKGPRPTFWKARCKDYLQAKERISSYSSARGITRINQLLGRVCRSQRRLHTPLRMQFNCSVQLKFALILMIFLIVPFVLYST